MISIFIQWGRCVIDRLGCLAVGTCTTNQCRLPFVFVLGGGGSSSNTSRRTGALARGRLRAYTAATATAATGLCRLECRRPLLTRPGPRDLPLCRRPEAQGGFRRWGRGRHRCWRGGRGRRRCWRGGRGSASASALGTGLALETRPPWPAPTHPRGSRRSASSAASSQRRPARGRGLETEENDVAGRTAARASASTPLGSAAALVWDCGCGTVGCIGESEVREIGRAHV